MGYATRPHRFQCPILMPRFVVFSLINSGSSCVGAHMAVDLARCFHKIGLITCKPVMFLKSSMFLV